MSRINKVIYLDNNATTRTDPRVLERMLPYFSEHYGNASSKLHPYGWVAEEAVDKAREQVAALLSCRPDEIVFTSGATEAVNLALFGLFETYQNQGKHIITVKTEHRAVLDTCEALTQRGARITYLGVDPEGRIDHDELKAAICPDTILVSIMAANNETGVLQDLEQIAELCRHYKLLFFSDATQYAAKYPISVKEIGLHALAFSAHKFYGPKGVGALYLSRNKPRLQIQTQVYGGGQQDGIRAGTLNVAGIVGMGAAAEIALSEYWEESARISVLRNHFEHQLLELNGLRINGSTKYRLYNTSNLCFPLNLKLRSLLPRYAFSSGSACSSASAEPSHVLKALGLSEEDIRNSFRFSFGRFSTMEDVEAVVKDILNLCAQV